MSNGLKHFVVSAVVLTLTAGIVEASRKPNIVVFLTDDQGYGDLGCFGSEALETPNIDRLCKQGMKFTDFYVHQRCSPTRLALMTGSHAHRAGCTKVIYNKDRIGIHADEVTTPELLKTAGYTTGIVGKWHLGEWDAFNPARHGFDSRYTISRNKEQRKEKEQTVDAFHTRITNLRHRDHFAFHPFGLRSRTAGQVDECAISSCR